MRKKLITTIKIKGRVKVSLPLKPPDMKQNKIVLYPSTSTTQSADILFPLEVYKKKLDRVF